MFDDTKTDIDGYFIDTYQSRVAFDAHRRQGTRKVANDFDKVFFSYESGCVTRSDAMPTGDFFMQFKKIDTDKLYRLEAEKVKEFNALFAINPEFCQEKKRVYHELATLTHWSAKMTGSSQPDKSIQFECGNADLSRYAPHRYNTPDYSSVIELITI